MVPRLLTRIVLKIKKNENEINKEDSRSRKKISMIAQMLSHLVSAESLSYTTTYFVELLLRRERFEIP